MNLELYIFFFGFNSIDFIKKRNIVMLKFKLDEKEKHIETKSTEILSHFDIDKQIRNNNLRKTPFF